MSSPNPKRQIAGLELASSRFLHGYMGLSILLLLTFLNGLIYLFVFPPWQHFDEPGHFEYGWLIANRSELPKVGDYDHEMRIAVAKSMIDHGFFDDLDFIPDLESKNEPAWIGISQIGDRPLYYLIISLPLRLTSNLDIDSQLYGSRFVSLLCYLFTIVAAWGILREITSPESSLRFLIPLALALLPGVAVLMTSVNNDVGAIAIFSLFIWGGVRLIKNGFDWVVFLLTSVTTIIGLFTKNTIYFALLLLPIILILSLLPEVKWVRGFILAAGIVIILLLSISWGDARYWYRSTLQSGSTRTKDSNSVIGNYALKLESNADVSPDFLTSLTQPIPQYVVKKLAGKSITFGAWMWSDKKVSVRMPILRTGNRNITRKVELNTNPQFFAFRATLDEDITRLWVSITPNTRDAVDKVTVFYDGLILVEGKRPKNKAPEFEDKNGSSGIWGGEEFVNHLRNSSGELGAPMFKTWLNMLAKSNYPIYGQPSLFLSYLLDWKGAAWHYQLTIARLFRTFWGQFGWGHVPLLGSKPYRLFVLVSAIGIIGTTVGLWLRRRNLPWRVMLFLGLVLVFGWGIAFLRGAPYMMAGQLFMPGARYGFSAIIPTIIVLAFGWLEILRILGQKIGINRQSQLVIYISLLLMLNVYSLISILAFYYKII